MSACSSSRLYGMAREGDGGQGQVETIAQTSACSSPGLDEMVREMREGIGETTAQTSTCRLSGLVEMVRKVKVKGEVKYDPDKHL